MAGYVEVQMTPAAFEVAYKLHWEYMHILATRLVGYQDAEDILQDATCRLLSGHLEKMPDDPEEAKPYFITALFSVGLNHIRNLGRERRVVTSHADLPEDIHPDDISADSGLSPYAHAENAAFLRAFRGVRMTTGEWQAVVEFYVKGRSTKDIARDWGVGEQRIRDVRHAALRKLREGLKEWK